jgi:hypothetical protein
MCSLAQTGHLLKKVPGNAELLKCFELYAKQDLSPIFIPCQHSWSCKMTISSYALLERRR